MKGRRLLGPEALILIALLVALGALSVRFTAQGSQNSVPEGLRPRRTVTSTRPGGWKAASLLLQRRGIPVRRTEKPPAEWPKSANVMVTADEYYAVSFAGGGVAPLWDDAQAADALKWVGDGRTLLVFVTDTNGLINRLKMRVDTHNHEDASVPPRLPAPWLAGVDRLQIPGKNRVLQVPRSGVTLFGDDKPAVVIAPWEKGRVIVVSSSSVIDNEHLGEDDNARFLVQTVTTFGAGKGAPVYFDEYHQGYNEQAGFWTAIGKPGQLALYQLLALALLAAWSAGFRFGLPRSPGRASRVSSEYVASMADLYRRARAGDAALEGVYLSFWRDLCRSVGVALDTPTRDVARQAAVALSDASRTAEQRRDLGERLTDTLLSCEAKIEEGPKGIRDRDLLHLARELEELRKELGLGRIDSAEPAAAAR